MPSRVIVSTTDVAQDDRFSYFREKVAACFDGLELVEPKGETLDARFDTMDIGDIQVCRITGSEHGVRRSRSALRSSPGDRVSVNYCDGGDYFLSDALGSGDVRYGALRIIDNASEFELRLPRGERGVLHCFQIPRMAFGDDVSFRKINSILSDSRLGSLVSEQYRVLVKALRLDNVAAAHAAANATKAMLLSLGEASDIDGGRREPNVGIASLKSHVLSRLSEPGLSIEAVAGAFRCSERTVQNRFAAEGETFSSWLLSQRLARAEEYLLAPAHALRSIEWIGFSCGFVATAHFHRAFKERFGMTPRTFRERGCSNGEGGGDFAPAQADRRGINPHGAC
ncbi:helix-turn-helix transcriptional regulator [Pleomorphomonas sp. JP5]|uniref:helix-turn-helix transcriptional regulator n=1 Tax=Pleomorphomonas sp. JP5 TaxID=2942998 RepID=UPI002042CEE4|nr:helix-turn-helix transcriptional regulator [Pleomorphomonas sp. JP5]MCM5556774.1 helix-turn-helix transcriptional regulator [Pleomorphomonas sp. JP5]